MEATAALGNESVVAKLLRRDNFNRISFKLVCFNGVADTSCDIHCLVRTVQINGDGRWKADETVSHVAIEEISKSNIMQLRLLVKWIFRPNLVFQQERGRQIKSEHAVGGVTNAILRQNLRSFNELHVIDIANL